MRAVRVKDDSLVPPEGGWGDRVYLVITSDRRECVYLEYSGHCV